MTRVLIFTYATPEELDVERLEKLNESYIRDLYGSRSTLSRIFSRKPDYEVIFLETRLGKLNSYRILDSVLLKFKPSDWITVINLGVVGSDLVEIGEIVECGRFIDVDMMLFDSSSDWTLVKEDNKISCNSRDMLVCNMDDSFQRRDGWKVVCDSEAYGQVLCCGEIGATFRTFKFVSNKFTENALEERMKMMPKACESLTKLASRYLYNFYYAKL